MGGDLDPGAAPTPCDQDHRHQPEDDPMKKESGGMETGGSTSRWGRTPEASPGKSDVGSFRGITDKLTHFLGNP